MFAYNFTVGERNIVSLFYSPDKKDLLHNLNEYLQEEKEEEEINEIVISVIKKVKTLTSDEYRVLEFDFTQN